MRGRAWSSTQTAQFPSSPSWTTPPLRQSLRRARGGGTNSLARERHQGHHERWRRERLRTWRRLSRSRSRVENVFFSGVTPSNPFFVVVGSCIYLLSLFIYLFRIAEFSVSLLKSFSVFFTLSLHLSFLFLPHSL